MWSDIPISLRIFQFVVIYTVKGFSLINEAEIDFFFLEFLCFFYDPMDVGNLTLWFYVISKLEALNYLEQYKEHLDIYTFEQDK